ncbi:aldehyde dehydrogenase [Acetobacter sp. TBRC 12305]|uniref:Aldehyde dehydrogenase n=2 Tax=Acetobacter garciniae TaxID=2817435 RepID=A0A939KQX1_9PROT|nr:aldehyde dehydrogenase [Acetobacter garciniae]MBO1324266.1 aldehyde dehydrogenase [Acetobacter garciniae]MBX0343955.1 aldehyde dehydrogenase [Acetobacter garciniae]
MREFEQYIDGRFEKGQATFESIDPATQKPWALMPRAGAQDVDRAVRAAWRAFADPQWTGLTATQRGKLLFRLADLLEQAVPDLAELETRDTGKIIRETRAQIAYIAEYYRYYGGLADKMDGRYVAIDKADTEAYQQREPIGVVAAIVPWNSQLFLAAVKLAPALAAGCTVVLKASEDGPAPLLAFARFVHEAGFPPGVVSILTGFGEDCGKALTSHPLVSRIAFTGGPETARHIVRNSADNLAYLTLELGGKSPVVVFPDADLDSTVNAIISGIFAATGQSCVAGSRLLAHRDILPALLDRLSERAKTIRIGPPDVMQTEFGPLATDRQRRHIVDLIARSLAAGATLVTGGQVPPGFETGFYFEPTILLCDDPQTPCLREEFFGPVLSVLPFEDEADAIANANDTPFGLASGLFTRDLARAKRVTARLRAGIVWVNTYRMISPLMPFGGFGLSGLGREGGSEAILDYMRTKSVWVRTSDEPIADPFVMR